MVRTLLDFFKEFLKVESVVVGLLLDISAEYQMPENRQRLAAAARCCKDVLKQVLMPINDYGLHHQAELYEYLMNGDLISTILEMRVFQSSQDHDYDQLVSLLENLLSLVAYDNSAVSFIIKQQIK